MKKEKIDQSCSRKVVGLDMSEKEFNKKLKEVGDEELLTIVDCHM